MVRDNLNIYFLNLNNLQGSAQIDEEYLFWYKFKYLF